MAKGVSTQVTDAVTQTNVKTVAESQAEAIGVSAQALAHATGLSMETSAQIQGGVQTAMEMATLSIVAGIVGSTGPTGSGGKI